MTELEKIAYAKRFIDDMANGINPIDGIPVPEEDILNNVRISRCLFYVSSVLEDVLKTGKKAKSRKLKIKSAENEEKEDKPEKTEKPKKEDKIPFLMTAEQIRLFEFCPFPISITNFCRNVNNLISNVDMQGVRYRHVTQWLLNAGLIEWVEWKNGHYKRVATEEGEAIGLILRIFTNFGRSSPVVMLTEDAQRFILDHINEVAATPIKYKGKTSLMETFENVNESMEDVLDSVEEQE